MIARNILRVFSPFVSGAIALGNFWYTYGLWPLNWWAWWGFGLLLGVWIFVMILIELEAKNECKG